MIEYSNIYKEKLLRACETARKQSQELFDLLVQVNEKHVFADSVIADGLRIQELFNTIISEVERANISVYSPDNRRKLADATSSTKYIIDALKSSLADHNAG